MVDSIHTETDGEEYDTGDSSVDEIPPEVGEEAVGDAYAKVAAAEELLEEAIHGIAVDGYRSETHNKLTEAYGAVSWCEVALKGEYKLRVRGDK